MGTGAFNVSRLIAELGLKQLTGEELDVLEKIQPVLQVGDLSDVTPPHVAPSAIFGAFIGGGVGTFGGVQFQSLAPGGSFVEWITFDSTTTNANFMIETTDPGFPTLLAAAGQASRDATQTIVRTGALATINALAPVISSTAAIISFTTRPIFIPRGAFFVIQNATAGAGAFAFFGVGWREVPASEFVPS